MADNPRQDLYLEISENLEERELTNLRNYVSGAKILPAGVVQNANAHTIFNQLEKKQKLKPGDLTLLADLLGKIGRHDYAEQAEKIAENERKEPNKSEVTAKKQLDEADVGTSATHQDTKRSRLDKKDTDEIANAFTSALTINYSNTLKTLKPLPWDDRFCLDLDKIFTHLVLVSHQGHKARRTIESLDDVFDHQPVTLSGQSKRFNVLVVGDAGSGKSTLLSKTALDWSCKKGRLADMNKIVLLIRLREVEPGESIAQIVWDQCVTETTKGISISSIETCLQDNESNVVFLLDGYDELVPDAKMAKQAVPKLLKKKCYPGCTVIVTSRPSSGIEQHMTVDCKVNVMGFSSVHVDKYVRLYFKSVEKPDLADSLVKALDSKANIVARGLIQTPMFLMLICVLWEDNPTIVQFPVTMSGLYHELLTCVIRKHCVREGLSMSDDEIPPVVSTALHHLGKLALESLLKGGSLVDLGKTTANQDTDVMVNLGIVSKEVSASRLHPREQLNFPHKSMQEFLAGRYVADRVNTSSDGLHSLVPLDTLLQQENLVQFICGCGGNVTSELLAKLHVKFTSIYDTMSDSGLWTLRDPRLSSLEEKRKSLKRLCLMSLYEGHDTQHFPIVRTLLASLDLTLNIPSREGAALKFYLDQATAVPEGRVLRLAVAEDCKGDAVEYLSSLVQRSLHDLQLYLKVEHSLTDAGFRKQTCYIGNKLDQLIPFLMNVPNMRSLNLACTSLTPESIQALRQILPKLTMLEELDLSDNPDIGDNEIDLLVLSKGLVSNLRLKNVNFSNVGLGDVSGKSFASVLHHLSRLEKLDLACNNIGNGGMEPFAAVQQPVASLKELDLSHNKVGDVCLGSLAAVLHHLSCLEKLALSHNNIGNEGQEPFAAIQQPVVSLKVLKLYNNKIGDVCLGSLVAVLHHLSCLEELDLSHNNIGNEGQEPFAAIQQPVVSLKVLQLNYNKIGDVCLGSLVAVLHHLSCLEELDLSDNNIGNEGKEPFAAIQQPVVSLKVLRLSYNKIGDVCMGSLVAVLHHLSCLEKLDLSRNNIGDKGKEPFAAIQQPVVSLKVLNLRNNKIGDVCMGSIVAVLHHLSCLEELDLSQNNIGNEPFSTIQQPVASLKVLDLCSNKIGDVCLGSLVAVLHHLSCLEKLDLSHNNIGDEGKEPFAAIQQPVVSLKVLRLSYNKIGNVCLGSLVAVLHHLSCLIHLDLSYNIIGDVEIASLAATLHHAPTLGRVFLNYNPVTAVGLHRFAQTIHRMPALMVLYLDPQQTVHLDDTAAMSICTMLTRLPVLERLSLTNISMQIAGFQAVNTAVEEHPTLQQLHYSDKCVSEGVNIRSLSSKIKFFIRVQ